MTDKLLNIHVIPDGATLKTTITDINANFKLLNDRIGLQFTTVPVRIGKDAWYENLQSDTIEDVSTINEDDRRTVRNPTTTPVARGYVRLDIENPTTKGVVYTDVIVAPHISDSQACIEQLRTITTCGVIFVDHTPLDKYKERQEETLPIKLMFWAMNSTPQAELTFDMILI